MARQKEGWDAYVSGRYVGTYKTDRAALAAAKKSDLKRRDERARAKAAAQPKWVCVRGRCVKC